MRPLHFVLAQSNQVGAHYAGIVSALRAYYDAADGLT